MKKEQSMNNVKEIGIYEPLVECLTEKSRKLSEFYVEIVLLGTQWGTPQFLNMGLKPYEIVKEWYDYCEANNLDTSSADNASVFLLDYFNKYNQRKKLKIISKMFGGK